RSRGDLVEKAGDVAALYLVGPHRPQAGEPLVFQQQRPSVERGRADLVLDAVEEAIDESADVAGVALLALRRARIHAFAGLMQSIARAVARIDQVKHAGRPCPEREAPGAAARTIPDAKDAATGRMNLEVQPGHDRVAVDLALAIGARSQRWNGAGVQLQRRHVRPLSIECNAVATPRLQHETRVNGGRGRHSAAARSFSGSK